MSKLIIVSIDDNEKAMQFLASLQRYKVVAYQNADERFYRASVLFAYLTDADGGIQLPTNDLGHPVGCRCASCY